MQITKTSFRHLCLVEKPREKSSILNDDELRTSIKSDLRKTIRENWSKRETLETWPSNDNKIKKN